MSSVQTELAELRLAHQTLVIREWTQSREPLLENLDTRLRIDPIRAHVLDAVERAHVCEDPTTHAVIADILPNDFYELVNAAIPHAELFPSHDR